LTISTIGGSKDDVGNSISVSQCGNILVTGSTRSNDGDFEGMNKGDEDIVVASIDTTGVLLWRKTLGGSFSEWGNSITSSSDGGLLLTGVVLPYDGDFSKMYRGDLDVFVVKLDSNGTLNPNTSIGIESRHPSSLSVTPNPLSSVSTISYFLAQPTMVRIELVNSIGVVICVLSDKQEEEGPHYLSFNTTGLRTGAYSIRLIQTDRVVSKMVILTR
jgi:hypothetical protein